MIRVNATVSARTGKVVMVEEEVLAPSPAGVPPAVSRYQFKAALLQLGFLADVENQIALASPAIELAWSEATTVARGGVVVSLIEQSDTLTVEQLDQVFGLAAKITA